MLLYPILTFLVLLIVGVIVGAGIWFRTHSSRGKNQVMVANSRRLLKLESYRTAISNLRLNLLIIGSLTLILVVLGAIGAGRPVNVTATVPEKFNRDIVLCLDASGSMFAINTEILSVFQSLAKDFQGERIGLTIFNSTSATVFPLTDNYNYILEHLQQMKEIFSPLDGSSPYETGHYLLTSTLNGVGASLVGDGLYACSLSFDYDEQEERSRSIILATDNMVNGRERVPLAEAATDLANRHITAYSINPDAGSVDETGLLVTESAVSQLSDAMKTTGGDSFLLSNPSAVNRIVGEIQATEAARLLGTPIITRTDTPDFILYTVATGTLLIIIVSALNRRLTRKKGGK